MVNAYTHTNPSRRNRCRSYGADASGLAGGYKDFGPTGFRSFGANTIRPTTLHHAARELRRAFTTSLVPLPSATKGAKGAHNLSDPMRSMRSELRRRS